MYRSKDIISTANEYVSNLNFHVFPCHSVANGVCNCGKSSCNGRNRGKHPANKNGCKGASLNASTITSNRNIGLATGKASGVFVLDVDGDAGKQTLRKLTESHGKLPRTWQVKTGSGGWHFYFRFDDRCNTLKNCSRFAPGLDIRTEGGYTILPPSINGDGCYSWVISPDEVALADAPDWLIDLIPKHGEQPNKKATESFTIRASSALERCKLYLSKASPAISGDGGHDTTYAVCCRLMELFGHELTDDELIEALDDWNNRCSPPWNETELVHKITQARNKVGIVTNQDDGSSGQPMYCTQVADDSQPDNYPTLEPDAYHGLLGEIVKAIEPETEADSAGVLLSLLIYAGQAIGGKPFIRVGGECHHANNNLVIVGDTASGKGMALGIGKYVFNDLPDTAYGLSSGEGLIERVCDLETENDSFTITNERKLLCIETEFGKPMVAMSREGNTLSAVLRSAWDRTTLQVMTRGKSHLRASNAFVSVIGHITPDELTHLFCKAGVEIANGFANRFLWGVVRSSKSLPLGGNIRVLDAYKQRLTNAISKAQTSGEVKRSESANTEWIAVYDSLKQSRPGAYGKATERARPHVVRLSLLFALMDGSETIETTHQRAALAVWDYCQQSAQMIFGGDNDATRLERRIVNAVRKQPGILKSELKQEVAKNQRVEVLNESLKSLQRRGEVVCVPCQEGEGRPGERYYPGWDNNPTTKTGVRNWGVDITPSMPSNELPSGNTTHDPQPVVSPSGKPTNGKPSMSFSEVLDWRNANAVQFVRTIRNGQSVVWVADESIVNERIADALTHWQDELSLFVPVNDPQPASDNNPLQTPATTQDNTTHGEAVNADAQWTQAEWDALGDNGQAFLTELIASNGQRLTVV